MMDATMIDDSIESFRNLVQSITRNDVGLGSQKHIVSRQ
jgi:hypothetical protein